MFGMTKKTGQVRTGDLAFKRLQMVLFADKIEGSSQMLEMMKNDILEVMRKYIDIDEDDLDIQICQQNANGSSSTESRLKADIPIKNMKRRK